MIVEVIERNQIKASRVVIDDKEFVFVNTTPHPCRFKDPETEIEFEVPVSGIVINAKPTENVVKEDVISFVKTEFVKNPKDEEKIKQIKEAFKDFNIVIIGSIIAAQAYKGEVVAMTPHPDYVRVPPNEKRMNPRKFTIY